MRAAVYARISLDRSGDSLSPDRQKELCRRLAESRGWEVVRVFEDRDISAFSGARRPAFDDLVREIRERRIDAVVAHSISRLARSTVRFHEFLELAMASGVEVACVADPIDTATPAGRLMITITAALAQLESEVTRDRVKSAHDMRAAHGRMHSGGSRAWGYERDGTVIEEEAAVIREVVERVLGGTTLRTVARDLNERELQTTKGNEWTGQTLGQALRSPRLGAIRIHNGQATAGDWEAILDEDTYQRLNSFLSRPRHERRVSAHLLTGLVVCGDCGAKLKPYLQAGGTYGKYACPPDPGIKRPLWPTGKGKCGKVAASKTALDAHVIGEWARLLSTAELRPTRDDEEREDIQRQLALDQSLLVELIDERFVRRAIGLEGYERARRKLQTAIDANEMALAAMGRLDRPVLTPGNLEHLMSWWEGASLDEQRHALRQVFHQVTVARVGKGGNRFKPERVTFQRRWDIYSQASLKAWDALTDEERAAQEAEYAAIDEDGRELEILPPR